MKIGVLESKKRVSQSTLVNTYIGGVAAIVPDKATLASKLNISQSDIPTFEVVGSDIQARIEVNYQLGSSSFGSDTNITSYLDYEGKCTLLGTSALRFCSNLSEIDFPGVETIERLALGLTALSGKITFPSLITANTAFLFQDTNVTHFIAPELITVQESVGSMTNNGSLEVYYAPKLASVPSNYFNNSVACFSNISSAYFAPGLQGNTEIDILINNIRKVDFVLNYTKPQASCIVDSSFTYSFLKDDGLSSNPVDMYELYDINENYLYTVIEGELENKAWLKLKNLLPGTSYNFKIKAIDDFYNASDSFATLNVTTKSQSDAQFDITGLQHYFNFQQQPVQALDLYKGHYFSELSSGAMPTISNGKIGNSYERLSSETTKIRAYNLPAKNYTSFTINVWLYNQAGASGNNSGLLGIGGYNTNNGFGLWVDANGTLKMRINRNFNNGNSNTILPQGVWTMVTYTWDGANCKLYFNGSLVRNVAYATAPVSANFLVAFARNDITGGFNGRIDELAIFDEVISQARIDDLLNEDPQNPGTYLGKTLLAA